MTTSDPMLTSLDDLVFDNKFVDTLPGDPELENYCRQVEHACYSFVEPTSTDKPTLVACSNDVAALLQLAPSICQSDYFTKVFSGNALLPGMKPFAMCYGGHQFGNWAGQLGDGRAINLGEVVTSDNQRWYLQLKGAGLTPYSRHADGLAVLRSSLREFLCSEAMHYLGVPTTRALSLTLTGDTVVRDMFYDGHPEAELGAVVCRVAPSFTRFGNFQLPVSRDDMALLKKLVDYTIVTDFPHLGPPSAETTLAWFSEVCDRTLEMIVHWMRVGFVHGVMNTDNMSILGLTIDYGPYGWLESYDPTWTPNTTDESHRRYRYEHQPQVAHWNLLQLANTILPIVENTEALEAILNNFAKGFQQQHQTMQLSKLGLVTNQEGDSALVSDLLTILTTVETDMTLFYRYLALVDLTDLQNKTYQHRLADAYYQVEQLSDEYDTTLLAWLERYARRCEVEGIEHMQRTERMNQVNPLYVLRNYLSQLAIDKANDGDYSGVEELLSVLKQPYTEQDGKEHLTQKRPEWARNRAGCSMLSCSS
ncbi:hypothetical protein A9Q99_15145 [Gammaproteobacteria bacterium 45_16_T64]|nr:hypothetical protein A9Q99_15145 [Gammaproteobacteria bacterium 45_16_T64]